MCVLKMSNLVGLSWGDVTAILAWRDEQFAVNVPNHSHIAQQSVCPCFKVAAWATSSILFYCSVMSLYACEMSSTMHNTIIWEQSQCSFVQLWCIAGYGTHYLWLSMKCFSVRLCSFCWRWHLQLALQYLHMLEVDVKQRISSRNTFI